MVPEKGGEHHQGRQHGKGEVPGGGALEGLFPEPPTLQGEPDSFRDLLVEGGGGDKAWGPPETLLYHLLLLGSGLLQVVYEEETLPGLLHQKLPFLRHTKPLVLFRGKV